MAGVTTASEVGVSIEVGCEAKLKMLSYLSMRVEENGFDLWDLTNHLELLNCLLEC